MTDKSINANQRLETAISYGFNHCYGVLSFTHAASPSLTVDLNANNGYDSSVNPQDVVKTKV